MYFSIGFRLEGLEELPGVASSVHMTKEERSVHHNFS